MCYQTLFFLVKLDCKSTEAKWYLYEWINQVPNLTALIKLWYTFSHKEIIFKIVWWFLDIPIGCFALSLSSLPITISLLSFTSDAGDQTQRIKIPSNSFLLLWEYVGQISRWSITFSYPNKSFKEDACDLSAWAQIFFSNISHLLNEIILK